MFIIIKYSVSLTIVNWNEYVCSHEKKKKNLRENCYDETSLLNSLGCGFIKSCLSAVELRLNILIARF